MAEAPADAAPQPRLPAGWQPDVQRLLSDLVPMLTPDQGRALLDIVKAVESKKGNYVRGQDAADAVAHALQEVMEALMAQAPSVVGAKLWQQCIDRQREEAAQRKRQADAELAASPLAKRLHQAMNSIADQYVCKITH